MAASALDGLLNHRAPLVGESIVRSAHGGLISTSFNGMEQQEQSNDDEEELPGTRVRASAAPKRAVTECGHNLSTVIVQTARCASTAADRVLRPLLHESAARLGWNASAGHVIEVLCRSMGLDFSADGKKLWRRADRTAVLS